MESYAEVSFVIIPVRPYPSLQTKIDTLCTGLLLNLIIINTNQPCLNEKSVSTKRQGDVIFFILLWIVWCLKIAGLKQIEF